MPFWVEEREGGKEEEEVTSFCKAKNGWMQMRNVQKRNEWMGGKRKRKKLRIET